MKTLTILLLAAVAVVASGMISDHSIIDRAFIVAESQCTEIVLPSDDEMISIKGKMKECLENEGHAHLTSHPALAADERPHLKHALCLSKGLKNIPDESRRNVSLCTLGDLGVLDGEKVNVTKILEIMWTKLNATESLEAKEFLSTALSNLSEEPIEADLLHLIELKKSLITSCVMNVVFNLVEEELLWYCPGQLWLDSFK